MPALSLLAFCVICWLSRAAAAHAEPPTPAPPRAIWSGVVFATNNPHPGDAPERIRPFAQKLRNVFGYNHFELVGESSEKMDDPNGRLLEPSKDFSLSVKTHSDPGHRSRTRVVLFQNRHQVAEFETRLNPESPLFIRGPLYGHGQLVIVLHAVDPSDVAVRAVRPPVAIYPVPAGVPAPPPREISNDARDSVIVVPKQPFYPPAADRVVPGPVNHPGVLSGEHGGDVELKSFKP